MKKELLLISNLRKDGRAQLTKISRETRIPVSTLFDMMKKTEFHHTCIPDFKKYGYGFRATVTMKVNSMRKQELQRHLENHGNVNSLWKINNGYDFMIEVVFRQMEELEKFCEKLDQDFDLVERNTYYIIEDIAREKFMSNPHSIPYIS